MSDDATDLFGPDADAADYPSGAATRGGAALGFVGVCLCFGALVGVVVGVVLVFWYLLFGYASLDVVGWWIFSQGS